MFGLCNTPLDKNGESCSTFSSRYIPRSNPQDILMLKNIDL